MKRSTLVTQRARALRRTMTETERWLWHRLRDRRPGGYKFVRQMPIGAFVADFACRDAKLVIEPDGSQHATSLRDEARDAFLAGEGYAVLRFWNHDVVGDIGPVCETILAALDDRLAPYDRYRLASPRHPSSGPSGHLLPPGEKGVPSNDRDLP